MSIDNTLSKVDRLAGKSRQKTIEAREQAKKDRAGAWSRVQSESPETADFLSAFTAKFGKPQYIKIELDDETVLNTFPR
ncbi:MAG: hypothetical protein IBX56_17645 [Methylomicrobium sp.]|nr:hypothetical protein [Methylomicrobium sp.]